MDHPTVTLGEAKELIKALAEHQSILLLSAPGQGKSEIVRAAAAEAGLTCRSLLGTQIAPEDVSGIPRIEGERSVFCPPRVLLPEDPEPFCLFLDELPAASPDVQKAFYSLILERRLGEHLLPPGTWVVAAGNRVEDRALVRAASSALTNRVFTIHIRADAKEWLAWAGRAGVRPEIRAFVNAVPDALARPVPGDPVPFSTPRAWASLSEALDLAESHWRARGDDLPDSIRRALAFGRVSAEDAGLFCHLSIDVLAELHEPLHYVLYPDEFPKDPIRQWFVAARIRKLIAAGGLADAGPRELTDFLRAVPPEVAFTMLVGLVETWGARGADPALLDLLRRATGLEVETT